MGVLVPDFGSDPHLPVALSTRGGVLELHHLGIHPRGEHLLFILQKYMKGTHVSETVRNIITGI